MIALGCAMIAFRQMETTAEPSVIRRIWPILITQICTSAAVGLNLTIAALAAVQVTGRDDLGGLAQTSTIIGATLITLAATRLAAVTDRLLSFRCTILLAVCGSLVCAIAVSAGGAFGWLVFVGLFLLGGGTVSALISRFVAAERIGPTPQAASAIGAVLFGSAIGSAVGPNIYGAVSALTDSPMPVTFLVSGVIFALGLIPLGVEKRKNYVSASHTGQRQQPWQQQRKESGEESGKRPRRRNYVAWRPGYAVIFTVAIIAHATMIGLMTMAPIYTDRAFGPAGSGLVMTAHLVGMYAFGPLVSVSLNRRGTAFTLVAGVGILLASIAMLVFLSSVLGFFVAGLFGVGLAWSVGMVTSSALVSHVKDVGQRVALQGRLDVNINIAAGVASIGAGVVVAAVGYPNLAAGVLVVVCLAVGVVAIGWWRGVGVRR